MGFGKFIYNTLTSTPGVGHAIGTMHHLVGNHSAGNEALNAATRSTAIVAAAVVTGGAGAVPAAIAYDAAASIVKGEPEGYVAATKNLVEKPSFSTIVDTGLLVAGDVASGCTGAKGIRSTVISVLKGKNLVHDAIRVTESVYQGGKKYALTEAIKSITSRKASERLRRKACSGTTGGDSSDEEGSRSTARSHKLSEKSSDEEDTDEEDELDDAFSYDDYEVDANPPLSAEQKRQALRAQKYQTPKGHLPRKIRNRKCSFSTKEQLNESKQRFDRDPSDSSNAYEEHSWRQPAWLHVRMPHTFNYTGAVVTNILQQGLLHIVIRHGHQFENHIPNFEAIFNELPAEIRSLIRRIQHERYEHATRNLTAQLERALKNLDSQTSEDTDEILYKLQMMVYDYLRENTVFDVINHGYLGDGCNNVPHQTVFFKVLDREGNTQVMVLCVSDQLYHNPLYFGNDRRPVRTITTCYFISWEKYISRQVETLFDIFGSMNDL